MPSTLGKNLHLCFTKIVCPPSPHSSSTTPLNHPDDDQSHPFPSTSSILVKNFNSLYDYNTFDTTSKSLTRSRSTSTISFEAESDSEPDFATVVASQRFFFTSPGRSNSIIESTPFVATPESSSGRTPDSTSPVMNQSSNGYSQGSIIPSPNCTSFVKDSVAVPTDSPDPYMDFRKSMQEMVEARDLVDVKANWDYLHELLLCYLALNPKSTHKFIVSAFADLLVSLMSSPETESGRREPKLSAGDGCRISG